MNTGSCKAIRCNDEMHCGKCGMQWGIDEDPPVCERNNRPWIRRIMAELVRMLTPVAPPMKRESIRYKNKLWIITLSDGVGRRHQTVCSKYSDAKRMSDSALKEFNK